jgi:O-succinylbenzoic acid--CoA ligase
VPTSGECDLVLVDLPAPEAAGAVRRAWDRGAAAVLVDPNAAAARRAWLLDALEPSVVASSDGWARRSGGRPLPGGAGAVVATSGTTAEPRFVILSRGALEASAWAVTAALGAVAGADRWLACVPLHHVAGLAIVARSYFCETALLVHPGFNPQAVAAAAGPGGEGCTLVSVVPTMLVRLLDFGAPVARFRRILVGGAPVPPAMLRQAAAAGARIATTYGLTETGGGCVHDGVPLEGVGVTLGDGGEILVRGPVVMDGYYRDPAATARAFAPGGWLRTGDLGRLEPEGRLAVTGRKTDVIITGGVNVSPAAVEAVLAEHPLVAEVCVAGLPDPEWGERVVAFVVPRPGGVRPSLEGLRGYGSERLSPAELPREVRVLASLPRSAGGKVLRRRLREG